MPDSEIENFRVLINRYGFTRSEAANLARMDWRHPGLVMIRDRRSREVKRNMSRRRLGYRRAVDYVSRSMNSMGFGNSISSFFEWIYTGSANQSIIRRLRS